ncbi:MAG: sugar nucleotide-binding protein [Melioribacteraceae bacterium]|nr:sugar nucleotide-binding protein [Melioribacteraceae bacterium]
MRVLITGASGTLGYFLNNVISKKHEILSLYNSFEGNCLNYNSAKVDLKDFDELEKIFSEFNPEVVIHTAAVSNVNKSRSLTSKDVYKINVAATEKLARLCDHSGAKLIYTSTDLVYAGYRGSMLTEDKKLIPFSLYAETKLVGESKIQQIMTDYIILRTALMYGIGLQKRENHFDLMFESLKNGHKIKLFSDQYRTPLAFIDAARMIDEMLTKEINGEVFNFGGLERLSRLQMGEILCEEAGFDKSLLIKTSLSDLKELPQVEDVSIDTTKLSNSGIQANSFRSLVRTMLNSN